MKSSFSSRSLALLGLAARVGSKEFTQTLKEKFTQGVDDIASGRLKTRIDQARIITEHLSQLKGAAMKAGQLLSLDASDFLPPEAIEILSKLQGKAEPVPWDQLRAVIISDLGEDKLLEFESLSTTPSASASIGQVHRGRLSGKDVAVKIQYPGVAESIDSDLKILKGLAQSLMAMTGRQIDLDDLFNELSTVLHQEADYLLESQNMREYGRLLGQTPGFAIPTPIDDFSARRVLTMTWEPGLNLNDWLASKPSREDREEIGRRLLELYTREFWDWGLVQTDPNYGNFLIKPHPLTLVVLDFGATLRYDEEFRASYRDLLKDVSSRDPENIFDAFVKHGLLDPRESAESRRLLGEMMVISMEPFQPENQPFKFTDVDFAQRTRDITRAFSQSLKYSAPPKKILFLHRKLGGVFTFLKKLEIELDVSPYWDKLINRNG